MRENHLGKALCRRILSILKQADISAEIHQCHDDDNLSQPIYRIEAPNFTVWVIAHRLLSANLARRDALLQSVGTPCQHTDQDKPQHLLIVSDHWFDRSKASKEIPAWWLGRLPEHTEKYLSDGIRLLEPAITLPDSLQLKFGLTEGQHQVHHPLRRNGSDATVHKYILLTAYYPLQPI